MKHVDVTFKQATGAISKCSVCTVSEGRTILHNGSPLLLDTGAKLYRRVDKSMISYRIGGYAWDGSDVDSVLARV